MAPMAERLKGRNGWSGLMMVTGATGPDEARTIRDLAPSSLFLVPGYGAQGASAAEALAGFVQGPGGLEGGVVSSSRGVNFPDGSGEAGDVEEWKSIISAAIAQARADLRGLPIPA